MHFLSFFLSFFLPFCFIAVIDYPVPLLVCCCVGVLVCRCELFMSLVLRCPDTLSGAPTSSSWKVRNWWLHYLHHYYHTTDSPITIHLTNHPTKDGAPTSSSWKVLDNYLHHYQKIIQVYPAQTPLPNITILNPTLPSFHLTIPKTTNLCVFSLCVRIIIPFNPNPNIVVCCHPQICLFLWQIWTLTNTTPMELLHPVLLPPSSPSPDIPPSFVVCCHWWQIWTLTNTTPRELLHQHHHQGVVVVVITAMRLLLFLVKPIVVAAVVGIIAI